MVTVSVSLIVKWSSGKRNGRKQHENPTSTASYVNKRKNIGEQCKYLRIQCISKGDIVIVEVSKCFAQFITFHLISLFKRTACVVLIHSSECIKTVLNANNDKNNNNHLRIERYKSDKWVFCVKTRLNDTHAHANYVEHGKLPCKNAVVRKTLYMNFPFFANL